ncbi:hypothetical protein [Candidatus Accumulibacter aalborgensis]|nr:hypothetical protein [Candidatus Accumulibacter aalborgensis]
MTSLTTWASDTRIVPVGAETRNYEEILSSTDPSAGNARFQDPGRLWQQRWRASFRTMFLGDMLRHFETDAIAGLFDTRQGDGAAALAMTHFPEILVNGSMAHLIVFFSDAFKRSTPIR